MPEPEVLTVVTPMYNEREAVDAFVQRLRPVLDDLGVTYEVIAVDDGSLDGTANRLLALRRTWSRLRVVKLRRNSDTIFKRVTAGGYYRLMRRLIGDWVRSNAGDFRLMSRAVVEVLLDLPERQPIYRLVVPSLGFPSGGVRYTRAPRVAGRTKYPLDGTGQYPN